MKRLQILGVTLVSTCALGGAISASASAVTFSLAEWLVEGLAVAAELPAETSGEIDLVDEKVPLTGVVSVLCSIKLIGKVLANGEDSITEWLDLTGTAISPVLTTAVLCTNILNCVEPLVWPKNLPWKTLLERMEDGTETFFVELITEGAGNGTNPTWELECMGFGGTVDECEAAIFIGEATNLIGTGVELVFARAFNELSGTASPKCTLGGANEGLVLGNLLVTSTEGTVSAS